MLPGMRSRAWPARGNLPRRSRRRSASDATKALKLSDIATEIAHVEELVKAGQAEAYAFMTNMSVDAPVAAAMRAKFRAIGVRKPHILGR